MSSNNGKAERKELLASRIIHSLPLVDTLFDYYGRTKNSNRYLKMGLDSIEGQILEPIVHQYERIDNFASEKVDQANDLVRASTQMAIQTAGYSVGYAFGFALGSLNVVERSIEGTPIEGVVEKVYNIADNVIDNVLPSENPAKEEREYKHLPLLSRKNPLRLIGARASPHTLSHVPGNTYNYTLDLTKRCSKDALTMAIEKGSQFLWGRVDFVVRNTERAFNLAKTINEIAPFATSPFISLYKAERPEFLELALHLGNHVATDFLRNRVADLDEIANNLDNDRLPETLKAVRSLEELLAKIHNRLYYEEEAITHDTREETLNSRMENEPESPEEQSEVREENEVPLMKVDYQKPALKSEKERVIPKPKESLPQEKPHEVRTRRKHHFPTPRQDKEKEFPLTPKPVATEEIVVTSTIEMVVPEQKIELTPKEKIEIIPQEQTKEEGEIQEEVEEEQGAPAIEGEEEQGAPEIEGEEEEVEEPVEEPHKVHKHKSKKLKRKQHKSNLEVHPADISSHGKREETVLLNVNTGAPQADIVYENTWTVETPNDEPWHTVSHRKGARPAKLEDVVTATKKHEMVEDLSTENNPFGVLHAGAHSSGTGSV